jgi:hypothetical protein
MVVAILLVSVIRVIFLNPYPNNIAQWNLLNKLTMKTRDKDLSFVPIELLKNLMASATTLVLTLDMLTIDCISTVPIEKAQSPKKAGSLFE